MKHIGRSHHVWRLAFSLLLVWCAPVRAQQLSSRILGKWECVVYKGDRASATIYEELLPNGNAVVQYGPLQEPFNAKYTLTGDQLTGSFYGDPVRVSFEGTQMIWIRPSGSKTVCEKKASTSSSSSVAQPATPSQQDTQAAVNVAMEAYKNSHRLMSRETSATVVGVVMTGPNVAEADLRFSDATYDCGSAMGPANAGNPLLMKRWNVGKAILKRYEGSGWTLSEINSDEIMCSPGFKGSIPLRRIVVTPTAEVGYKGLATIASAERVYCASYNTCSKTLQQLGPPPQGSAKDRDHFDYIDKELASGIKGEYRFLYRPRPSDNRGRITAFEVFANPTNSELPSFYMAGGVFEISNGGTSGEVSKAHIAVGRQAGPEDLIYEFGVIRANDSSDAQFISSLRSGSASSGPSASELHSLDSSQRPNVGALPVPVVSQPNREPERPDPLNIAAQKYPGSKTFRVNHDHTPKTSFLNSQKEIWKYCQGALIITNDAIIFEPSNSVDGQLHAFNALRSSVFEIKTNMFPIAGQPAFHVKLSDGRNFNLVSPGIDPRQIVQLMPAKR